MDTHGLCFCLGIFVMLVAMIIKDAVGVEKKGDGK
jgi:hypothetical protein